MFISIFIIFKVVNNYKNNEAKNFAGIKDGYYLDLYTEDTKDDDRNGIIKLDRQNKQLYVYAENYGKSREYILKLYLDYKEVEFGVNGTHFLKYEFSLGKDKNIEIPITINNIKDNHKLTAVLIASPDKHASELEEVPTSSYGMAIDYYLDFNNDIKNIELHQKIDEANYYFDDKFYGFIVNDDFSVSSEMKYPPKLIKVNSGERVKLATRIGEILNSDEVLLCLDVGGRQVNLDNGSYKRIDIREEKTTYCEISFQAPVEPGKYEVTGFIVKNPTGVSEFMPLDFSLRFTLEVI